MSFRMITPAGVTLSLLTAFKLVFDYLFCSGHTEKFNQNFGELINSDRLWTYAHGRDALFEALKAMKTLKPEKAQVLMPVYTCQTVLKSVLSAGLTPVLYDTDPDTLGSKAENLFKHINENTLAIIAGGMYGIGINMSEIKDLCQEKNIYLIEDVAQSLGCAFENRVLGTWGDIAIYSFGQSKPVSALGGGALTTTNEKISTIISNEYSHYSGPGLFQNFKDVIMLFASSVLLKPFCFYWLTRLKNNFEPKHDSAMIRTKRMSALNAAIGNFQILSFYKITEQRKNNAELIENAIKNKVGIKSILPDKKSTNTYLRLPMICDDIYTRDKWIKKLKSKGLWASDKLYEPIYMFTDDKPESFPLFNSIQEKILLITTHPYMNKKDIENLKPVNLD